MLTQEQVFETRVGFVARKLSRTNPQADAKDIAQDAWEGALRCRQSYRHGHPGAEGFVYRNALLWAAPLIARRACAFSLSFGAAARYRTVKLTLPSMVHNADNVLNDLPAPERLQVDVHRLDALRIKFRRVVERALADADEFDARVAALVIGLDRPPMSATAIARKLDADTGDVRQAIKWLKRTMKARPDIRSLWQEIQQQEEGQPS